MPRRIMEGIVVGNKADKTISVKVERLVKHPIYKKIIKRSNKFAAHDPENRFKEGDKVQIIECAPISKTKTWHVVYSG